MMRSKLIVIIGIFMFIILLISYGVINAQENGGFSAKKFLGFGESTIATIIVGLFSICLAIFIYRRSVKLDNIAKEKLKEIEISTKVTEYMLNYSLLNIKQSQINSISNVEMRPIENIGLKIENFTSTVTEYEKENLKNYIFSQIASMLNTVKDIIENVPAIPSTDKYNDNVYYGFTIDTWNNFIKRIDKLESEMNYLSIKWMRETLFKDDIASQQILQKAIHSGILLKSYRDNPKNRKFPTAVCELNRKDMLVKQIISRKY